jgi:hypothetical protein
LPEPVGAEINVWRRALIAGQASAWAGVGASNRSANHAATAGWNNFSTFVFGPDATDRGPATRCPIDPAPVCFSRVKSEAEYRKNALRFGYFYKLTRAETQTNWRTMPAPIQVFRRAGRRLTTVAPIWCPDVLWLSGPRSPHGLGVSRARAQACAPARPQAPPEDIAPAKA